jgi:hypothetical protein
MTLAVLARRSGSLETAWKRDLLRRNEWTSDFKLDLAVREKRDVARLACEEVSVEDCDHRSKRRADSAAREWLTPDVEEVAECVRASYRGFDVDDPVGRVRMQPHEARRRRDEATGRRQRHLIRRRDADPGGHLPRPNADENPQMRVDVKCESFAALARDAVDPFAKV